MKKFYLRGINRLGIFVVMLIWCSPVFSVNNLEVSGVNSPSTNANGTYTYQGERESHHYWMNSNGWYIYWFAGVGWDINPELDGDNFYASDDSDVEIPTTANTGNWDHNSSAGFSYDGWTITEVSSASTPTVTTTAASSISAYSATLGGNVTYNGGATVDENGIVYSTTDNTPTVAEGATKIAISSGTGSFSQSIGSLSANTTYYYNAYAHNSAGYGYGTASSFKTLTPGTWTGDSNTDWATAGNWAGNSVPSSSTDVTIPSGLGSYPVISTSTSAECNNLTVNSGASLTIASSSGGTGSLIVSGTSSGTVTCQRYMTGSAWHLVSPTAAGGSISTFIQNAGNAIPSNTGNYGMMSYNETSNTWNSYYTSGTGENLTAGKGYCIRRSSDGLVTFSGTLTSGTKTVSLTKGGSEGWNCIGNPYPSALNMNTAANATYNFLATNSSLLDASYACMYLWDQGTSQYLILGNSDYSPRNLGFNTLASGQAFFVKAASNGVNVTFNKNMQAHSGSVVLKSADTSWKGFELTVSREQTKASTIITFNEEMTTGLDVTYDAGLLRGGSGLEVYSRLVEDNGVDFAVQCLPESYNSLVIPVGLENNAGGEITFGAENVEISESCKVILEDKTTQTITDLTGGETYKTTVTAGKTDIGRFFIHTSYITTGASIPLEKTIDLKVYLANGQIQITGGLGNEAQATLFDITGRNIGTYKLQQANRNNISAANLIPGVYMLKVTDNGKHFNTKVIIY